MRARAAAAAAPEREARTAMLTYAIGDVHGRTDLLARLLDRVNQALAVACIGLVLAYRSSSNLAAAYGIAVSGTMTITTVLYYEVMRIRWNWPIWKAGTDALDALPPLLGVPVGLKDLVNLEGTPTTAGSRILEGYVSPYDATIAARLKQAGAVIVGKTNMDEFAMGSSTEFSAYKKTVNPWDLERIPGGSSGGSSAAVAAYHVPLAIGTDTGGSIRQPASLTGIVGLKPMYGRVSRYGIVAFASSLDQVGPFARTVADLADVLGAIAGHDERDSTSYPAEVPNYLAEIETRKGPWKLGIPKEYFGAGLDPEVAAAVERAVAFYRSQGCEVSEVSLPHTQYCLDTYYIIATAEASSNLARYDGIRFGRRVVDPADIDDLYMRTRAEGFGAEVKRRIILGTYVLSSGYYDAYYLRAQKVRTLIREDFLKVYQDVDALITPTSPVPAFKLGEKSDPLAMYLCDIYTIGVNLAGLPAISVPSAS